MLHFAELSQHDRGDTSKSNGRLVSGIFTSIAEFERELIRDRVRSGLAAARARGRRAGRPQRLSGWSASTPAYSRTLDPFHSSAR